MRFTLAPTASISVTLTGWVYAGDCTFLRVGNRPHIPHPQLSTVSHCWYHVSVKKKGGEHFPLDKGKCLRSWPTMANNWLFQVYLVEMRVFVRCFLTFPWMVCKFIITFFHPCGVISWWNHGSVYGGDLWCSWQINHAPVGACAATGVCVVSAGYLDFEVLKHSHYPTESVERLF